MTEGQLRRTIIETRQTAHDRLLDGYTAGLLHTEKDEHQSDANILLQLPEGRMSIRSIKTDTFCAVEMLLRNWKRIHPQLPDWQAAVEHYIHFQHAELEGQFVRGATYTETYTEAGYQRSLIPFDYKLLYEMRLPRDSRTASPHVLAAAQLPALLEQLKRGTVTAPSNYDLPIEAYKQFKPSESGFYQILASDLQPQ